MKKSMFIFATAIFLFACSNEKKENAGSGGTAAASPVALPYTATYSSKFNENISDSDLLNVLNSYKYWENGDIKAVAETFADSVTWLSFSGTKYTGAKSGLIDIFSKSRDSLRSVKLEIAAWTKNHSTDKNADFVNLWYKETDTYKTGKVDSANFMDINLIVKGKIAWYSTYRQELKSK